MNHQQKPDQGQHTNSNDPTLENSFVSTKDIPKEIRLSAPVHQRSLLIDGTLVEWHGPTNLVYSPIYIGEQSQKAERALIGSYPLATTAEALLALDAATRAFDHGKGEWPAMPIKDRVKAMQEFTYKMIGRRAEIVKLIVWEIGKTIADAEKEFDRTVDYITESLRAVKKLHNQNAQFLFHQNFIGQTKKIPHGVVLCMGPFNYPLNETFTTLIPALLMGNTVLFKPPKHGTLLFEPLLEAFAESFPKGVVNTVYGRGRDVVPTLMQSGKVDVLALIGSSKVADSLKKMHPKSNRLKSILGLDAKNAAIVLSDADINIAVKECVAGALSFNGQRCTALKILFVHRSLVTTFNESLIKEVAKLGVGMPWTKGVSITPLAEPDKPVYLNELLRDAEIQGAKIINAENGGGTISHSLVKPAILYPVDHKMRVYREEQFGPIIPVVPFDEVQTPIDYVTGSPYGQQVSLFGKDPDTLGFVIDILAGQVGRININTQCQRSPDSFPFNGRKDSAEGTLSIDEALNAFSVDSVVATKQGIENEQVLASILERGKSKRLSNTVIL
jgi:acyl-CoA reductase-like NAD-dependent aldehyde dehydrogenase